MGSVTPTYQVPEGAIFPFLAKEIAADINELETILNTAGVDEKRWEAIRVHPVFLEMLNSAKVEWSAATNTEQRVKLKSAAMLELWLEEANKALHDPQQTLAAKTELAKFIGRLAGLGLSNAHVEGGGERFSLTINLGADNQLKIETVTPKVIEHSPTQETSGAQEG